MKAEISHHGFLNEARYSGVYLQQGRMITDRDWNALCDRLKARIDTVGAHTGGTGIPREDGLLSGFAKSGPTAWSAQFPAAGGLVCADGLFARAEPKTSDGPFSYHNQADLPGTEPLADGALLYADIWEQTVTAFDDTDLLDPGLHGADTGFVTRTLVQIKQCPPDQLIETPCGLALDPASMPEIGNARFGVSLRVGGTGPDNCDPCAETVNINRDVGNYLFRVEVHDVIYDTDGMAQTVTLKWSSENGATRYVRPSDAAGPELNLAPGYVYEFFDPAMDLLAGLPPAGYGDQPARGALAHDNLESVDEELGHIRRWDGYGTFDLTSGSLVDGRDREAELTETGAPDSHGLVTHADGTFTLNLDALVVTIAFGPETAEARPAAVLAGDYWLALARTAATETHRIRALSDLPVGIRHRYCVLGECDSDGITFPGLAPADKRRLTFPVLPCLDAGDVRYDPGDCAYAQSQNVADVKEALDAFCTRLQPPYHALRMSQGTGQEGNLGATLPGPIEVVVEDQDGAPVEGVTVAFEARTPATGGQPVDRLFETPSNNPETALKVVTDATGRARIFWQLNGAAGLHTLEASLADPVDDRPVTSVTFAALATTGHSTTDLATITGLAWANGDPFENDAAANFATVEEGLIITFSRLASQQSAGGDTIVLTAELPQRHSVNNTASWWFEPHIICAVVRVSDSRGTILVRPNRDSLLSVFQLFRQLQVPWDELPRCVPSEGMRFRVKLSGRFTLSADDNRPVDAFLPGRPSDDGSRIALDLENPGLGHPSDLDAWFYIHPNSVRRFNPFSGEPIVDTRIDINTATPEALQTLDGIGRGRARQMVDGRPWRHINELVERGVLTSNQFDSISNRIRV